MSELIRYTAEHSDEHPEGEYVEFSDYEKLLHKTNMLRAAFISRDDALTEIQRNLQVSSKEWVSNRISMAQENSQKDLLAEIEASAIEKFKRYLISKLAESGVDAEDCDLIIPQSEFSEFISQLGHELSSSQKYVTVATIGHLDSKKTAIRSALNTLLSQEQHKNNQDKIDE